MNAGARIGFLGGTLDPIHQGHLETARAAQQALRLDRVEIVPARQPPHRHQQPSASPYHRFAMAALAVNGVDGLAVSELELGAPPGPSYTADTLQRLQRSGLSPSQIFFITGADAFADIEAWRCYPEVLDLAHFVVVSRPGHPAAALRDVLPALAGRMTQGAGSAAAAPTIFLVDARTPDVSSTGIRGRIARGEPLSGLVPAAVEAHIVQHGLYGSTGA